MGLKMADASWLEPHFTERSDMLLCWEATEEEKTRNKTRKHEEQKAGYIGRNLIIAMG
jgi:hypothetical protein